MGIEAAIIAGGAVAAGGAIGGSMIGAGAAGSAADTQAQAMRDSIAAQERMADKGMGVYTREADRARQFLRQQTSQALALMAPLRDIGLANLKTAQGFTDPNSPEAQAERDAFGKTLERNLAARGLTGSGMEVAGLSDFELGLARERRNIALGLAGVGANTLSTMAGMESQLGTGLAGISQGLGAGAMSLYGGLGQGMGNSLMAGGQNIANMQLTQGQMLAQGLIGAGNAFQGTMGGLTQMALMNKMGMFT